MKQSDWDILKGRGVTPDNLSVGGSLYLEGTQITALPDNLSVGGYLDLRNTQITALPDNLSVGGYLNLEGTQITALPDNLSVGGSLYLRDTQLTALPDSLSVGGYLDLGGTQITALPDNLSVGGGLYLRGSQITQLGLHQQAPAIPNIHKALYEACSVRETFNMDLWHSGCGTTHCRAGWVVHLAGQEGYDLEAKYGTATAALSIYEASDPGFLERNQPNFHASSSDALADMKALAEAS